VTSSRSNQFKKQERRAKGSPPEKICLALGSLNNVYNLAATFGAELNFASLKSEQGVVFTLTDVYARVKVSAALANNDFACVNYLACITLNAKTLRIGIAAVTGGTNTFFGSHFSVSPLLNLFDLNASQFRAETLALFVTGLVFVLLDDDLWTTKIV
jgi:hypothetical protein